MSLFSSSQFSICSVQTRLHDQFHAALHNFFIFSIIFCILNCPLFGSCFAMKNVCLCNKCECKVGLSVVLNVCNSLFLSDVNECLFSFLSHYFRFLRRSIKFPIPVCHFLPFLPKDIHSPLVHLQNHPPDP